jgi:nicotinamidase-related amidase
MRLPTDTALIVIDEAPESSHDNPDAEFAIAALLEVWREERMPVFHVGRELSDPFADPDLEASLEAIGATTLVICGALAQEAVAAAAGRGYRVFVVADGADAQALATMNHEFAQVVTSETTLAAGRRARARERWKAARRAGA